MRTGDFPGHRRGSGVKGCVLLAVDAATARAGVASSGAVVAWSCRPRARWSMLKVRDPLVEAAMSGHAGLRPTSTSASVSWSRILVTGVRIDPAVDRRRSEHRARPAAWAAPVDIPTCPPPGDLSSRSWLRPAERPWRSAATSRPSRHRRQPDEGPPVALLAAPSRQRSADSNS